MGQHNMASEIAATLALRNLLVYGDQPSQQTVGRWIEKLESLPELEMLEIASSEEGQTRVLREMR